MTDDEDKDEKIIETNRRDDLSEISALIVMISASRDSEQSAGIKDGGGVFTSAFLQTFKEFESESSSESSSLPSWLEVIERIRSIIKERGFLNQVPQISASTPININDPFMIVPPKESSFNNNDKKKKKKQRKRAVLIGINYIDQPDIQLTGCHNDCFNIQQYLITKYNFDERDMALFLDDGKHFQPTKDNILKAFTLMAMQSDPGDVVFIHYAGHGRQTIDIDGK